MRERMTMSEKTEVFLPPAVQNAVLRGKPCKAPYFLDKSRAQRVNAVIRRRDNDTNSATLVWDRILELLILGDDVGESLLPVDLGFEPLAHDSNAVILYPGVTRIFYPSKRAGYEQFASGSYHDILLELEAAGYHLVCDQAPDGRDIRFESGRYAVRPKNGTDWIEVDTLDDAYQAYFAPLAYR